MGEVSRRSQVILINEIIRYHVSRPIPSIGDIALDKSQDEETHTSVHSSLQTQGYSLGAKIISRLTLSKGRIWESNKCMVFICRDLWIYLFGKQATRLQSNSQGVYIVFSDDIYWLENVNFNPSKDVDNPKYQNTSVNVYRTLYLSLISGIIKGSLESLGFPSTVDAVFDEHC
ncbi:hypothetical protein BEWA_020270 [Theileria equi strain WA]|uniref:Trafficking protein particle complex subunit n=1 Tax=Theileria equi strain WA TaxID=1537102 RepID=L0AVX1_THEEQ|nr:hypothetical protein BEWA_020270 [Theileria equi strain WA]AFZ79181.1 hypothetical protein BEWA_020270 [Theileria equi strain WA]|eukprot:XP_004828847.1 hypothetical protein BEWA_020270 [Theileria equi strain WA]